MYGAETLLAEHSDGLEQALWVALRALEDNAALAVRIMERARQQNRHRAAKQFEQQAQTAKENAKIIRDILLNGILYQKSGEARHKAQGITGPVEARQPTKDE